MMKATKYLMLMAAGLLTTASCSGSRKPDVVSNEKMEENKMETKSTAGQEGGKVLIVYFSHAGENYSVGNIKVGNTKLVAEEIQKVTGGDTFEIVAEKSYDMSYQRLIELAQEEARTDELPAFKGAVDDISRYDTIFVGGPIWWGTYPRVMFTFFNQYDLNGKTLIPFTTHEGSGLGSVVEDLKRLYPKATVTGAFSMYGHEVRNGSAKIDKWLKGLGY